MSNHVVLLCTEIVVGREWLNNLKGTHGGQVVTGRVRSPHQTRPVHTTCASGRPAVSPIIEPTALLFEGVYKHRLAGLGSLS